MKPKRSRSRDSWSTVTESFSGASGGQQQQHRMSPPTVAQHQQLAGRFSPESDIQSHGSERISSPSSESASWMQRIKWMKTKRTKGGNSDGIFLDHAYAEDAVYHGAPMEPEAVSKPVEHQQPKMSRNSSQLTHSSQTTKDSIDDFHDSEWTPPDSSYGAAIPVAGWIPKHIRRAIEWTLIVFGIVGLVFLIVTTSIRVTDETGHFRNATDYDDGGNGFDDDVHSSYSNYDEQNNDDVYAAIADDYFDDTYAATDDGSYNGGRYNYGSNTNYGYSSNTDDYY